MEVLHRTTVTKDQIDHLGHMNVRYYSEHASSGASGLARSLGLETDATQMVSLRDRYVRHYREQLVGAPLEVRGGVLEVGSERLRMYEELVNADTDELAATFVLVMEALDRSTGKPVALPQEVANRATTSSVALPEHGQSRSIAIDDDPAATAPSLGLLLERDLAGREVRTLSAAECDDDGFYAADLADLVWGGVPLDGRAFQPFHDDPDGARIGWATMETRSAWAHRPRVDDRVQSFGAEVDLASKTTQSRRWVYDVDSESLVCTFAVVNLAFDVAERRAVVIPAALRASFADRLQSDLAGAPAK